MKTKLIDGKKIAGDVRQEISLEVAKFVSEGNNPPHLTAVIVGKDPASQLYVRNKGRACASVGMTHETLQLSEKTTESELINCINYLNEDNNVSGILIQLPLPKSISTNAVLSSIDSRKDVDGLSSINLGQLMKGEPNFVPATPLGVRELIIRTGIKLPGKHVVIIGRSTLVGRPLASLLSIKSDVGNATVTLAHSATKNLKGITSVADILIVAIGIPEFIDGSMIKKESIIIDVGINKVDDASTESGYRIVGDVNLNSVMSLASAVSPVPGGVGPMTVAMVVKNTLKAAKILSN